jgi:hypothetical protein
VCRGVIWVCRVRVRVLLRRDRLVGGVGVVFGSEEGGLSDRGCRLDGDGRVCGLAHERVRGVEWCGSISRRCVRDPRGERTYRTGSDMAVEGCLWLAAVRIAVESGIEDPMSRRRGGDGGANGDDDVGRGCAR